MEGKPPPSKTNSDGKTLLILIVGITVAIWFLVAVVLPRMDKPRATARPPAPSDPYAVFQTVRNDCGMCGTSSPVGGWEARDGRWVVFSANGDFTLSNDRATISGVWEQNGREICFAPGTGGESSCLFYEQKTDAMMLGDVIYIRE